MEELLVKSGLLLASVSAVNDTEAYVRASAMSVIGTCASSPLWKHINSSEIDVIHCCYAILLQDSEALARRAATKALTSIAKAGHLTYVF